MCIEDLKMTHQYVIVSYKVEHLLLSFVERVKSITVLALPRLATFNSIIVGQTIGILRKYHNGRIK